jgi:hypothetical protein
MDVQIRDAVHNFVRLREKETELIGTHALQRLRGIRQLAMAALVYPGAVHTRFDHTLGVSHVAGQMADALHLDVDTIQLIRYAALLHDIGHGPFSHVSEHALERYADRTTIPPEQKKEKIHELVTAAMINTDDEIQEILGKRYCDNIIRLLGVGFGEPVARSVVSGPLDADKQDYLLRDSYFCGVEYGVFDMHQLHRSLTAHGAEHDRYLMLKPDGIHAAEQYVLAKYYLTTNVYRHKVRLITDQMIVRAICLGVEIDNIEEIGKLYRFDNSEEFVHNYSEWDDNRFLSEFGGSHKLEGTKCQTLLSRLLQRRLFKRVFQGRPKEFSPEAREFLLKIHLREHQEARRSVEAAIASLASGVAGIEVDADFVILHAFDIKSVKEMSRNDEASILVAQKPEPTPFEEESRLFSSIDEGFKEEFVEVYAPVEWKTRTDREHLCDSLREPIRNAIEQHCRAGSGEPKP